MQTTLGRRRSRLARPLSWLVVAGLAGAAIIGPGAGGVAASNEPGSPDYVPNSGHTSSSGLSLTMGTATINCDGSSVNSLDGSFTFSGNDAGDHVVVYLAANNGSNATPAGNVQDNELWIDLDGKSSPLAFSIPITSAFTATQGGVLIVFASDVAGTKTYPSKSNSLNCTETTTTTTSSETTDTTSSQSSETTESTSSESSETTDTTSSESSETTDTTSSESSETTESTSSESSETTESTSSESSETTDTTSSESSETTESTASTSSETTESTASTSSETTDTTSSESSETTESTSSETTESTDSTTSQSSGGEVEGVQGTPHVTLPPTSTLDASTTTGNPDGLRIVLLGLAVLLASMLLLQPRSARSRK